MRDIFVFPAKEELKPAKTDSSSPDKKQDVRTKPEEKARKINLLKEMKTAFSAFAVSPKDVHFENQEDGENMLLLLRRHWVTNIHWLAASLLMILAPSIIFPTLSFLKFLKFFPFKFQLVFLVAWYILTFSYVFVSFINWYFNVYIITNHRVIDVDFYNLLYKEISACSIEKIQDVTYKVGGTIGVLFDFGNIYIQTAGEEENIEFELVPKPALIVKRLTGLMEHPQS